MGYYLLFGVAWLLSIIPFWMLYRLSDILYLINFYIVGYRKEVVYRNLRNSFPEKDPAEIDRLARAFYRHFCDFLLESIKGFTVSEKEMDKRFFYRDLDLIRQLEAENRDIALVSAHYNNWEWLALFAAKITQKFLVIYRPLNNKAIDRLTQKIRGRCKPVLAPMEHIFREALKQRAANQLFVAWFLADQRPPQTSRFWTTFLNQEAAFFEGVEKISRKLELAVVFMDIRKVRRGCYEINFTKLFDNGAKTREHEITLACVRKMEEEIKARPEFWLWSHNRFKHIRPGNINLITS